MNNDDDDDDDVIRQSQKQCLSESVYRSRQFSDINISQWKNYYKKAVLSQGNRAMPQLLFLVY